jgi:hypothetical protein
MPVKSIVRGLSASKIDLRTTILRAMANESAPLILTMPIAPAPEAVDIAHIVVPNVILEILCKGKQFRGKINKKHKLPDKTIYKKIAKAKMDYIFIVDRLQNQKKHIFIVYRQ